MERFCLCSFSLSTTLPHKHMRKIKDLGAECRVPFSRKLMQNQERGQRVHTTPQRAQEWRERSLHMCLPARRRRRAPERQASHCYRGFSLGIPCRKDLYHYSSKRRRIEPRSSQ